jgi:hypothetical protein
MSTIDTEKNTMPNEAEVGPRIGTSVTLGDKDEVISTDGDDALKLAGAHAYQFDEKYFARLRWKIVSPLELSCSKSSC